MRPVPEVWPASDRGWRDVWALGRVPGFAQLSGVRSVSLAGDGIFHTSLAGAVFFNPEHATTATQAAAGFAVLLLPYSLLGPFAGVLLDHWRRTRVLVICNVVRAVLVAAAAGVLVTTGPSGPAFYLVALAAVSAGRLYNAAAAAALPHVVPAGRLVLANSVWTVLGTFAALVGGALRLGTRQLGGAGDAAAAVAALSAAAVYACSSVLAGRFGRDALGPLGSATTSTLMVAARAWYELVDGARNVAAHRQAAAALAAIGVHRFLYGISTIATLLLYRNYFTDNGLLRAGLTGAAQVVAAAIAGALLAAAITPAITRRWSTRGWITVLYAVAAAVQVTLGPSYQMAPLLAAAVLPARWPKAHKSVSRASCKNTSPTTSAAGSSRSTTPSSTPPSWLPQWSPFFGETSPCTRQSHRLMSSSRQESTGAARSGRAAASVWW